MKNQLLMIVHPGSACGSAEMNLGRDNADEQRSFMAMFVEQWEGGVVVIDGEMSDEMGSDARRQTWSDWGRTIEDALARAKAAGHLSERIMGDDNSDFNQEAAAAKIVKKHKLKPENTEVSLTGAWIQSSDGGGCVTSVEEVLTKLGFTTRVEDAMDLDFETHEMDEDEENEEVASTPPVRTRKP